MISENVSPVDKTSVAESFRASSATYEENAVVQKIVSQQLLDMLMGLEINSYRNALEIGCCTGFLTAALVEKITLETLYLNDLVKEFCLLTEKRVRDRVDNTVILPGDIEKVSFPENLHLVISSSTLQWVLDLAGLLQNLRKSLAFEGVCAFSMFGPGTMGEIGALTGRCLRYLGIDRIEAMVLGAGLEVVELYDESHTLYFPSVRSVLRHIRATGVGGLGQKERWTRSRLKEFEHEYVRQFGTPEGLPVTYNSTYLIARKK